MHVLILFISFILKVQVLSQIESNLSQTDTDGKWEFFSKCYDELGCVKTDSNWYDAKFRPVNLKPVDRRIIKTDFVMVTVDKSNNLNYAVVTPDIKFIRGAGFVKDELLFLLIHDFTSNGDTGWIKHISEVLLSKTHVNVISVDWRHGAEPPYDQAIANARVVALEIINFLKVLKESRELDFDKVHIIGHGVGAHIAGYVGTVFGEIKKITGLDPNGPRFEGMPEIVRLDSSDAKYVEVLHTDAFQSTSQGSKFTFGHSDFFLNNAMLQPGCVDQNNKNVLSVKRESIRSGDILPGCSHKRSFKYFIEALEERECIFLGIECDSYENFSKGKCIDCGEKCKTFGRMVYQDSVPARYYLNTGSQYPYCMYQYRVTVYVGKKDKPQYHGQFELILVDVASLVTSSSMTESRDFLSGANNTFVFYAKEPEMGFIKEARVKWVEPKKKFCLFSCKQSINIDMMVISSLKKDVKKRKESVLCPRDNITEIESGDYHIFYPCSK